MIRIVAIGSLVLPLATFADGQSDKPREKESLAALQPLVGAWRGVGQPQRGSTKGAWIENTEWSWDFSDRQAKVRFSSPASKYIVRGDVRASGKPGQFLLKATHHDNKSVTTYTGTRLDDGRIVFDAADAPDDFPARISIRLVAKSKRMLVLYERKRSSNRFFRLAEVGLTRKGSGFGGGATFVECVVTGGKGTIPVTYEGRTYYVCCGGCRDHFNEDPAAVLAEYRAKKRAEKDKANKDSQ